MSEYTETGPAFVRLNAFAAAALLEKLPRRSEECGNDVARFELKWVRRPGDASADGCFGKTLRRMRPGTRAMSVSVGSDFVREEGKRAEWALVLGRDARDLVTAVNKCNGVITVLDAATGAKMSESPPITSEDWKLSLECVAASQVGELVLVATGHWSHKDGIVRVREAKVA
jgi:hypothetical protein